MPAEWEPHAATWLAWPHNPETWPGRHAQAREQFVGIVRALCSRERVRLLELVLRDPAESYEARETAMRFFADGDLAPLREIVELKDLRTLGKLLHFEEEELRRMLFHLHLAELQMQAM